MFSGKLKPYEISFLLLLQHFEVDTILTSLYKKILLKENNNKK